MIHGFTALRKYIHCWVGGRPKASVSDIDGGSAEIASGSTDRPYMGNINKCQYY